MNKTTTLILLALGGAGSFLWVNRPFPARSLIVPASVQHLTADLPQNEDAFIRGAWARVYDNIGYSGYGSNINLIRDSLTCDGTCTRVGDTLAYGYGNCVSMAALLTSMLRTRLPAERALMAIGTYSKAGMSGGHAWTVVERAGEWYLADPTGPPNGWTRVEENVGYEPELHFNDQLYFYNQPGQASPKSCGCGERMHWRSS